MPPNPDNHGGQDREAANLPQAQRVDGGERKYSVGQLSLGVPHDLAVPRGCGQLQACPSQMPVTSQSLRWRLGGRQDCLLECLYWKDGTAQKGPFWVCSQRLRLLCRLQWTGCELCCIRADRKPALVHGGGNQTPNCQ